MATRILIVDDRAVVRTELRNVFELTGTINVVGEAADGWDAVRQARALKPDIVLMDLEMPGMDGLEATRRLKAGCLARVVIVFTVYGDAFHREMALQAGADGFVIKGADMNSLLDLFDQLTHR